MAAMPSIIAILIKLTIIYFCAVSNKSNTFVWLVAMFFINNVAELLIFFGNEIGISPDQAIRIYYISIFFVMLFMCNYSLHISRNKVMRITLPVNIVMFVTAALLIAFSDLIVQGSTPLIHGHTADKGQFYIVYTALALYTIIFTFSVLASGYSYKRNKDHNIQKQCLWSLVALSSFLLIGLTVVLLMALGLKVSALTVLPFGTTFFVLFSLITENKHKSTDIRSFLPFTLEYKMMRKAVNILSEYSSSEIGHNKAMFYIEKIITEYKYEKEQGNMKRTADSMDVPRSTAYNKAEKLGIKVSR